MKIKFKNFCGIFATLFVTTTMVLLASCSQDDDNYDSDMYTLAEMGTRLGNSESIPGEEGNIKEDDCGYWVLVHLGLKKEVVDSLMSAKGWSGNGISTKYIYEIGEELLGFRANLKGDEAQDSLFSFRDHKNRRPQNLLIYSEDHISIATYYGYKEMGTLNSDGRGNILYLEVYGIMY
jgi:hypothetical protein